MKHWNITEVIQKQVNLESWIEWSKMPNPELPLYKKEEVKRNLVGYINFFKTLLLELRP